MAPKIIQDIELRGQENVKKGFDEIGQAGTQAFDEISVAAARAGSAGELKNIETAAKRAGVSFGEMAGRVKAATNEFKQGANSTSRFTSAINTFQAAGLKLGSTFQAIGASIGGLNLSLRDTGTAIRGLGRATGATGLSRFGRTVSVLGRNLQSLAVPAAVVGLGLLANSAANAAEKIGDEAFAIDQTTNSYQDFTNAGIAAGISTAKAAESATKLQGVLKQTRTESNAAAESQRAFKERLGDARDTAADSVTGFSKLNEEGRKLALAWSQGSITIDQYQQGQRKLRDEGVALSASISKQDKDVRRLEEAHRRDQAAATENASALTKLGIAATDSAGKLKDHNAIIDDLAQKFGGTKTPIEDIRKALNDLGLDRRWIPALQDGAAGVAKLRAESERLAPKLTETQIALGEKFAGAVTTLIEVLTNLKNVVGAALAPAFLPAIEGITNAIVAARPQIIAFAEAVGRVLGPVLSAIGTFITSVLVPVFNGWVIILQKVADFINQAFGTNLKAVDIFVGVIVALAVALGGIPILITAIVVGIGLLIENWQKLKDMVGGVVDGIKAKWNEFWSWLDGKIQGAIAKLKSLNPFASTPGAARGEAAGGGGGGSGFASGGRVFGGGTPTSDSIRALLSRDEYVTKAKAAKYYGYNFMHALNNMRIPKGLLRGFAEGGRVTMDAFAPRPLRFAQGGAVPAANSSLRPLSLTFPGMGTFDGLLAPDDVANRMVLAATKRSVRSGGRKPSWVK